MIPLSLVANWESEESRLGQNHSLSQNLIVRQVSSTEAFESKHIARVWLEKQLRCGRLASNALDFFNFVNQFYGCICDFCTSDTCPIMNAGHGCEYQWVDSSRRSLRLSGPQYIDSVLSWVQSVLDDESMFPTKAGVDFPKEFPMVIKAIFKQLFRVLAHIYHNHYDKILHLSIEPHLNTLLAHMICFSKDFDLIDKRELAPMSELISIFEASHQI